MTALGNKGWASAVDDEEAEQGAPLAVRPAPAGSQASCSSPHTVSSARTVRLSAWRGHDGRNMPPRSPASHVLALSVLSRPYLPPDGSGSALQRSRKQAHNAVNTLHTCAGT